MARRPGTRRGNLMSPARYFRIQRGVLRVPEARKRLSTSLDLVEVATPRVIRTFSWTWVPERGFYRR